MRVQGDALVSCNGGAQLSRASRVGSTFRSGRTSSSWLHTPLPRRRYSRVVMASSSSPSSSGDPAEEKDLFVENARLIRFAPVVVGALSFLSIAANKVQSAKEASSGRRQRVQGASKAQQRRLQLAAEGTQSRADVLAIANSATSVLTGLVWLSLRSREPEAVEQIGQTCYYMNRECIPERAVSELDWMYQSMMSATRCQSMVVFYKNEVLFQGGLRSAPSKPLSSDQVSCSWDDLGQIVKRVIETGKGNYLANAVLYPGSIEFFKYIPETAQSILIHPLNVKSEDGQVSCAGVVVLASDTQRGFSSLDQAWISDIADKLVISFAT